MGDDEWLKDEGHLTNRSELPVTRLNFGGVDSRRGKRARFHLGPIFCSGLAKRPRTGGPGDCRDLWLEGVSVAGYYMVKAKDTRFPRVVFCDFSKLPGEPGYQRTFGSPGNLRKFAAFDVSLDYPFRDDFRYLNFTSFSVNTENAFDTREGIFRVPYAGTYLFSVHAMAETRLELRVHRNGIAVAALSSGTSKRGLNNAGVGQSFLLDCAEGDEIRLFNFGGDIFDDATTSESTFHFVGVLLHSSDRE